MHPLDLALRAAGLTALGAGALPHTIAQPAGALAWDDLPLETLPDTEQAITDALALARLLKRLAGGGQHPFANTAATATTLTGLGAAVDPDRLAVWWEAHAPVLTPKALAAKLRIAPQTATALLREMQGRGVAREVTGRGRFRAYAV